MPQKTIFGNIAREPTYYNHKPTIRFECFVEAFYYFNKKGKTKQEVFKKAVEVWKSGEEDKIEDFLTKYKKAVEKAVDEISSSNTGKSFFIKKNSNASKTKAANRITEPEQPIEQPARKPKDSCPSSSPSIVECFLDELEPGLSSFIQSIPNEKLLLATIESAAKSYFSVSKQILFLKDNCIRKVKSALQNELNDLSSKLNALSLAVKECNKIKIEPTTGLLALQKEVDKKTKMCNEIGLKAMGIKTFIEKTQLKINLNRRVEQVKKRCDFSETEKISKIDFFCCNDLNHTWAEGIFKLAESLDILHKLPVNNITSSEIIHLANVLETSSLVSIEGLCKINVAVNDAIVKLLVKHLPIYSVSLRKGDKNQTFIVNFLQTDMSCDVIDRIFDLADGDNKGISNNF